MRYVVGVAWPPKATWKLACRSKHWPGVTPIRAPVLPASYGVLLKSNWKPPFIFPAFLLSCFPSSLRFSPLFLAFLAFPPSCQTRKRRYRLQHRLQLQRKSGTKKPNHQANPSSVASFVPPRWSAPNLTGFLTLPSHPATLRSTTTFYSPPPFAPLFYPSHQSAVHSTQHGSENAGCHLRSQKRGYQEQKAERRGSQVPTTHGTEFSSEGRLGPSTRQGLGGCALVSGNPVANFFFFFLFFLFFLCSSLSPG